MTNLGGQNDEKTAEDVDKIEEKVEGVADVVFVSAVVSLHYQLSVKENKPTKENETSIHIQLRGGGGELEL